MRRSSGSTGRPSVGGPLRVKHDQPAKKARSTLSTGGRFSFGGRLSFGGCTPVSTLGSNKTNSRPSTSGVPAAKRRMSSRDGPQKDPRPIGDRAYKEKSIHLLIQFLTSNGYPFPISTKLLHSPQSKDFVRIFEFVYGCVETDYKCVGKLEDEIPKVFKMLGYPIPLSKSAMYTIGSPHTWPTLLAALSWLREMVEHLQSTDLDNILFAHSGHDDFDNVSEAKLVYDYCDSTYTHFLQGGDCFEEYDNELGTKLRQQGVGAEVDNLAAENQRLLKELTAIREQENPMNALKDALSAVKVDQEKMEAYDANLTGHMQRLQMEDAAEADRGTQLEAELEVTRQDVQRKRQILATQEISAADLQRMNRERQELRNQIEAKEREQQELDKNIWDEELVIAKGQAEVDKKGAQYNTTARMLQLIPVTAENSSNVDFELKSTLLQSSSSHWQNTVKPALNKIKNQMMDKVRELEESMFSKQDILAQLTDQVAEQDEVLAGWDEMLLKMDADLENLKKTNQEEITSIQDQIEQVKRDIMSINQCRDLEVRELRAQLVADTKRLEQLRRDTKREQDQYAKFLAEACTLVINHKTAVQDKVQSVRDKAASRAGDKGRQTQQY